MTDNKETEIEDYLDEDRAIPGQKYVCLSFVSPDKLIADRKDYFYYNFLKSNYGYDKSLDEFREEFNNYSEDNEQKLQDEFDEIVDFKTNVRGVKVRGVYDNIKAANIRAQVLQKLDRSFHVFVGQVGYWLPWDPNANNIEEQEYLEKDLNRLVKEYNTNKVKKDMFYEERKQEKKKAAIEASIKQKEINDQKKKEVLEEIKELEESKEEENNNTEVSDETVEQEVNNVSLETKPLDESKLSSENQVDQELKESLEDTDPWMKRKMEESNK